MFQYCYFFYLYQENVVDYFSTFGLVSWISLGTALLGLILTLIGVRRMLRWERITIAMIGLIIFTSSLFIIHYSRDTFFIISNYSEKQRPDNSWQVKFDLIPKGKKNTIALVEICCETNNNVRISGHNFEIKGDKKSYLWDTTNSGFSFCSSRTSIKPSTIFVSIITNIKPEIDCKVDPGVN